jgi:hypothetical protein
MDWQWAYAVTVAKTCCQDPWLGICRDCMLPKHAIKSHDRVYAVTLAKTYTVSVKSHGWEYAVVVAKTCCQQPWLGICLVVTVAKTCYMP